MYMVRKDCLTLQLLKGRVHEKQPRRRPRNSWQLLLDRAWSKPGTSLSCPFVVIPPNRWKYINKLLLIQWIQDNSTSDNSKTCLAQTKFEGPCLSSEMIICWAYLEPLVITRPDKLQLVPPNYLSCGWMCLRSCLTSFIPFTWEKNLTNFRKPSQEKEYIRAKWTRYSGHMATAKGEYNS